MSLSKVLKEMEKVRGYAEENVDQGPVETLSGRRGRKKQALEQLKDLKRQYTENLLRSAIFVLVTGDQSKLFETTASEQVSCMISNPEEFYRDLAQRVHPSLYLGKESLASLFDIVGRHLEDKAREMGVLEYPQLQFKNSYRRAIKSQEDFVQLLKVAINEQVGGEMVGIHAVNALTEPAIKNNHAALVTPIIMSTDDSILAMQLFNALKRLTPKVSVVLAGEGVEELRTDDFVILKEVTGASVKQTINTIKKNCK